MNTSLKNQIIGNKYQIKKQIGQGSYGQVLTFKNFHQLLILQKQVYLVEKLDTKEHLAIKILSAKNMPIENLSQMHKEADILEQLSNENIISFKDFFETPNSIYLVLEYCPHGTLKQFLRKYQTLTENQIWTVSYHLLKAVSYLHSKCILHRDIKLENILIPDINELNQLKLADFGFALNMSKFKDYGRVSRAGTMGYMAPETFQIKMHLSSKNDIWSLGVLLYKLLHKNKHPFLTDKVNKTNIFQYYEELKLNVAGEEPKIYFNDKVHPMLKHLIKKMLRFDLKKRISAKDALKHPYFTGNYEPLKGLLSCQQEIAYEKEKFNKFAKLLLFIKFCEAYNSRIIQKKQDLIQKFQFMLFLQYMKKFQINTTTTITTTISNNNLLRNVKQFKINQQNRTRRCSSKSNLTTSQSTTKLDSFFKTQGSFNKSSSTIKLSQAQMRQTQYMQKQLSFNKPKSNLLSPVERRSLIVKQQQELLIQNLRPQKKFEGNSKLQTKINLLGNMARFDKSNQVLKKKINQNMGVINSFFMQFPKNQ